MSSRVSAAGWGCPAAVPRPQSLRSCPHGAGLSLSPLLLVSSRPFALGFATLTPRSWSGGGRCRHSAGPRLPASVPLSGAPPPRWLPALPRFRSLGRAVTGIRPPVRACALFHLKISRPFVSDTAENDNIRRPTRRTPDAIMFGRSCRHATAQRYDNFPTKFLNENGYRMKGLTRYACPLSPRVGVSCLRHPRRSS